MGPDDAVEDHLEDALAEPCRRHTQGCELTSYIGQIQPAQGIMNRNSNDRSIVNVKSPFLNALLQNAPQNAQFPHIETAPGMLKLNDIAEKFSLQRAIAYHGVTDLIKTTEDVSLQFLVGRNLERRNLFDGFDDVAHLAIDNRKEDLRL